MTRSRRPTDVAAVRAEIERLRGGIELEHEVLDSEPFSRPARARIWGRIRILENEVARLRTHEARLLDEQERLAQRVGKQCRC